VLRPVLAALNAYMKYLATIILLLLSPFAVACKCSEFDSAALLERAQKAYVGKIINAKVLGKGESVSATLLTSESFKGKVLELEEVISDTSSCGVIFTLNESYLVFEGENGQVDFCTMFNGYINTEFNKRIDSLREQSNEG